jgi:membrane protein YdbS with pleckstrin-like domain
MNEVPACFSVERDADGVLKIRYQKPGRKFWSIYFTVVISYFLICICYFLGFLLVHGSRFAFNLPFSFNPALPSILFYLLLIPAIRWGAHGTISDQTLSLQESELVVTYHNLPFGRRYSIPKSGVRRWHSNKSD